MSGQPKIILSMMSGTSIDCVDAVLVRIFADMQYEILASNSLDYPNKIKEKIYRAANNNANTSDICILNFLVGEIFAQCALSLIKKSGVKKEGIDFISSHGQTIFHNPSIEDICGLSAKSTLQIGDISLIAERTGIMTIGDFRTKDVAAGGQGAPLVPFADEILFGREIPRGILNIGGISNITVLSPNIKTFAFDIGVGNMLIDYFSKKLFNQNYDNNGEIAQSGKVDVEWLEFLLKERFYAQQPPKSTGRELFNEIYAEKIYKCAPKEPQDVIATLTELTAKTIFNAYKNFILPKTKLNEIVVGGGGAYNLYLLNLLQKYFAPIKVLTHENFGIDNKLKEALAFAFLGYMTYEKKFNNLPMCTGAEHSVIMGKISL